MDCKVWRANTGLVFCGLRPDAQFATWLLDSLAGFVQGELTKHLIGSIATKGERRLIINGFVMGCTQRISARLVALCKQSEAAATGNGRALVVVKGAAIHAAMKTAGITLGKSRRSSRRADHGAYRAGQAAGEHASFGRPVSGNGATLRIGR
jgi:hypothetical protein